MVTSSPSMRLSACLALALLWAAPARAQKELLFGTGKPPTFREEDADRRFLRSRVGRALARGTESRECVQLLGGLLTVLAEIGPTLHRRDENFVVDPHLLEAVRTQLSHPRFPASAYLAAMVRRVLIDRKLPDAWLETAEALNPKVQIIDLAKLRFLHHGLQTSESFLFTLPMLKERYAIEVERATTAAEGEAWTRFRDDYLDRDVAWGGLRLLDIRKVAPQDDESTKATWVAVLQWEPPSPDEGRLTAFAAEKEPPIKVVAKLAPEQYVELSRLSRGSRLLVKGRLWEAERGLQSLELRDALLFQDRDWSRGVVLADPRAVQACALAVNELGGIAPQQPGGFRHP